ncbi:MAG: type III pantothenate kinase [Eubacteriales bacterium]
MLLAVDIGNSNIVIGGMQDTEIIFEARIATDTMRTSDQYGAEIRNIISLFKVAPEEFTDCIISSVVPPVFHAVRTGIQKMIDKEVMIVGPGTKTGMNIQMESPSSVGGDLIVAAVAASSKYPLPIILIDLGTATTVTVIGEGNTFLGGCIIPGVRVASEALSSRTAQLPGIQLDKPERVIGKNTVDCMRSGIMYGAAGSIDGIIERMEEELGQRTTIIATGGIAPFVTALCKREIHLERNLVLEGLGIVYEKNKDRQSK